MPTHNHDTLQGPQRPTHNFTNSQFKPHHSQSKHSHSTTIQPKSTTHLPRHHNSRHHNMSQPRSAKLEALNSDHFPIFITFKNKYKIFTTKPLKTLTNNTKANWFQYTKDLKHTLKKYLFHKDPHTVNNLIANAILESDRKNIFKGTIKPTHTPLFENITTLLSKQNHTKALNYKNPSLPTLNQHITHIIQQPKKQQ